MKTSMAVNNPTDGPPTHGDAKIGKLQGAIKALNVREKPNMNAKVLYILVEGQSFSYVTTNDPNWLEIIAPAPRERGYAMAKYIVDISGDTS